PSLGSVDVVDRLRGERAQSPVEPPSCLSALNIALHPNRLTILPPTRASCPPVQSPSQHACPLTFDICLPLLHRMNLVAETKRRRRKRKPRHESRGRAHHHLRRNFFCSNSGCFESPCAGRRTRRCRQNRGRKINRFS